MGNIFSPAMRLMNRLKYSQKIIFLGFIVIAIIFLLSIALNLQLKKIIINSTLQNEGIERIIAINDLIQLTQQYRGSSVNIIGKSLLTDLYNKKEQETETAFFKMIDSLDLTMSLKVGKEDLSGLTVMLKDLKNNHVIDEYTTFIKQLHLLMGIIADHYRLNSNSDLPTHYMTKMILKNIPDTTESMGLIRATVLRVLVTKQLPDNIRRELIIQEAKLEQSINSFKLNLTKAVQFSPALAEEFNRAYRHLDNERQAVVNLLNSEIYNKKFNVKPEKYWSNITKNIDALYILMHQPIAPYIHAHLNQRISEASTIRHGANIIAFLLLLIVTYFLIALHKALLSNINTMADRISQAQSKENEERERFETLFEKSSDGHVIIEDGVFTQCNEVAVKILGYSSKQELMRSPSDLSPQYQPDGALSSDKAKQLITECLENKAIDFEWVHRKQDGTDIWIDVRLTTIQYRHKSIILVTWRDLSLRKKIDKKNELRIRQLEILTGVFNLTNEGIMITDQDNLIINVNRSFCKITQYSRKDVIGQHSNILSSGKHNTEFYHDMWKTINNQSHWQGEIWNRKKNGDLYAESLSILTIKNKEKKVLYYVGIFSDITKNKQQQQQLELMAHYDILTGLPNRALFIDRFNQAITRSKRSNTLLAICFLDLDNFKPVNDNFGHDVGDKLLIKVAGRIKKNLREEDTISRQGGDEFTILLGDINNVEQCEDTLKRIHHSLSKPYKINNYSHSVTASIGVTLYPFDESDIDTLLRHADHAMYQAKQTGRNRFHFFNTKEEQKLLYKHHRLEEIQQALQNDQLHLYYQPKVNMKTGDVIGAEALIRWLHPDKGLIPPLDFLPIIEGTELEIQIGNWVIEQALLQLSEWNEQGIKIEISINISSNHLLSTSFIIQLESALSKYPSINAKYFQLEILESSALGDLQAIRNIIKTCQEALGVSIALDDFGTGYSSLTHLSSLSANTIKIDRTFVRDMLCDSNDHAIIEAVIRLATSFNLNVIAEGVENTEQGLMLLMMGCDEAQGYGIAKPMISEEFPSWLTSYIPKPEWIACGLKKQLSSEVILELFRLASSVWFKQLESNILSSPDSIHSWPILSDTKSLSGYLIERAYKEHSFELQWLDNLKGIHQVIHFMAEDLVHNYQKGNIKIAREGLTALQMPYKDLDKYLALDKIKSAHETKS